MAYGDGPDDESLRDAWKLFCTRLLEAGDLAFKDYNPASPLHRADAFRFLTQNLGQAFDLALETRDSRYPVLHPFCGPARKLGGDAADIVYLQAWIDGSSVYRVSGNRGSARFINFTLQGQRPEQQPGTDWPSLHDPFGDIPEANLFGHELQTEADGSFELYLGGPERVPNWLPSTTDTRKLFVRQGFDGWDEKPARLHIERVDMVAPRPMPTPATIVESVDWAGRFVKAVMSDWPDHPYHYSEFVDPDQINTFPGNSGEAVEDADLKRGRAAANMCWQLAPDEALIIEFDAEDNFWMMCNLGVFFNSFDYLYRPVSYTPSRTRTGSDGKVRFILCHDDPGYHNWLDTQGFERGNIIYRNLLSTFQSPIHTRLVKRADLEAAVPDDTARVTPHERIAQLQARFKGISQRYNL